MEQLRSALGALYGQDPAAQQNANAWLSEFAKNPEAWAAALGLLDPASGASTEAAFFSANLLLKKTRDEWGRLTPQQREELCDTYNARLRALLRLPAPGAAPPDAAALSAAAAAAASAPTVLVDRLALLVAGAAALGGLGASQRVLALAVEAVGVARALGLTEGAQPGAASPGCTLLRLGLLLLQLLADEAQQLDRGRRGALVGRTPSPLLLALQGGGDGQGGGGQAQGGEGGGGGLGLAAQRGSVVGLVREVLRSASAPPEQLPGLLPVLGGAVRCLASWVLLDECGEGGTGLSAGELEALSPGIVPCLLRLLALQPADPAAAAAAAPLHEAVADVVSSVLGSEARSMAAALAAALGGGGGGAGDAGGDAASSIAAAAVSADSAAAAAGLGALVELGPQVLAAAARAGSAACGGDGESGPSGVVGLVRVAAALASRDEGGLVTGSGGAGGEACVALARTVVTLLEAWPLPDVVEPVFDYLFALNTTPTASRHPALGPPLYGSVLPAVLRAVAYPGGFVGWDEAERDEDAFYFFRDQHASELLETMYAQVGVPLVQQLVEGAVSSAAAAAAAASGQAASPSTGGTGGTAPSWREVEAALFCLRAVHLPVKKAAALGGREGELSAPAAAAKAAELQGLLGRLFGEAVDPCGSIMSLLHAVPWFAATTCRLLGEYAAWFGRAPGDSQLQGALGLVLHALRTHGPSSREASSLAAAAFRSLATRGSGVLAAEQPPYPTLTALLGAAAAVVAPGPPAGGGMAPPVPLQQDDRVAVVEGLARLAAALPPEAAAEAGCAVVGPVVLRAQSVATAAAAAGGALSPAALSSLAAELGLLAAAVRFLELPGPGQLHGAGIVGGHGHGLGAAVVAAAAAAVAAGAAGSASAASTPHPALRALQVAWPVLSAIAAEPQCQRDPGVVEALCELYKRSLLCTKLAGRVLLPPLISSLLALLAARPHGAALDVLGTVVELFGEVAHSDDTRRLQVAALDGAGAMMGALVAHLVQGAPPLDASSSPSELAAGFLQLADRTLLFARGVMLGWGSLPASVEWACGVLRAQREREPQAAALSYIQHLVAAAERLAAAAAEGQQEAADVEARARLDAVLSAAGPSLLHALMVAGADTAPRALMRPLAGCLAALLGSPSGPAGRGAAGGAGAGGRGPACAVLRDGAPRWLHGAWQLPPLAELQQRGRLQPDHVARFTALLLRGHPAAAAAAGGAALPPPLPRGRLDALVGDFFALARGEASEDVLLAYEM